MNSKFRRYRANEMAHGIGSDTSSYPVGSLQKKICMPESSVIKSLNPKEVPLPEMCSRYKLSISSSIGLGGGAVFNVV
jgi:hypothetical protein